MNLRGLPSVEQLLQIPVAERLMGKYGRPLTLKAIQQALEDARGYALKNREAILPDNETLLKRSASLIKNWIDPTFIPVINATGVILHTNLGRAPLSTAVMQSLSETAGIYTSLEINLETGKRGSRQLHVEALLTRLTGAQAALVVNNNAAAVLLILAALASRKRVILARSQLIEIGDGFRLPDVMKLSSAKLVEVGTINQVHISDYSEALSQPAALVMHARHSNFKIVGFTGEPDIKDIADLAHKSGVLFAEDLGAGALLPTECFGLAHEPTVQEALASGADLVCFSGDKLLGGPQAGIILGKFDLIARIKKHPLARPLRIDKLSLAALHATLLHYLKGEAEREIPIWRMISTKPAQLRTRARKWASQLRQGEVLQGESTIGGGSLPGENLPTWVLALKVRKTERFLAELRNMQPPILARTEKDRILFDPRTVLPEQDEALLKNLRISLHLQA